MNVMGHKKKQVRQAFRDKVFGRSNYHCECCGVKGMDRQNPPVLTKGVTTAIPLDAHHITDRHDFPNGGYVLQNGISVCDDCHMKAEQFHSTGTAVPGYSPDELYKIINSSFDEAYEADARLAE
jgi:hypothetical protein